jgi:hypothetical protein
LAESAKADTNKKSFPDRKSSGLLHIKTINIFVKKSMANIITGTWTDGKHNIKVNLNIIIFKEDETQIVYCPALNITGYGVTEKEAMDSFKISIGEYFVYTSNKKTLRKDLESLGWKIRKSLRKPASPPDMTYLLNTNDEFRKIFDNYDYLKTSASIALPAII